MLLLLAVAVAMVLRAGPLSEHLRNAVANELARRFDREVTIGSASFALSGRVALREVVVRNPDGSVLLTAPEIDARVGRQGSWLPLLSAPTEVQDVRVLQPAVTLRRDAGGRWSISDLIERQREEPSRFRGDVIVEGGRLIVVDEGRGGLTTTIEDIAVSVHYPEPGRTVFTARAGGAEGGFQQLDLHGRTNAETGVTEMEGSILGLELPYAFGRVPAGSALRVASGRADVRGKVTVGGRDSEETRLSYDVEANVSGGEMAFPWLRQPIQAIEGRLRLVDGDVHLEGLSGTVAGAPVSARGTIADLTNPSLDLDVSAAGIRYHQVRALFPSLAMPVGVILTSPLRVAAHVEGPTPGVRVIGEATTRAMEFRTVPWHDLVGEFEYSDGRLKITGLRAHGSPRQLEAELELDLSKARPEVRGSGALINMPLSVLAEMAGLDAVGIEGTVQMRARGHTNGERFVAAQFEIEDAAVRGVDLGRLAGEIGFSGETVRLQDCRLVGPAGEGTLEAEISTGGDYKVEARFSSLDLSALAAALGLEGVRGRCPAKVQSAGRLDEGRASGSLELGPGQMQGRRFERLSATFSASPERLAMTDLRLLLGAGSYEGEVAVDHWRAGLDRAQVQGHLRVAAARVRDWLGPSYSGFAPEATVYGTVEVEGSLSDPTAALDLRMHSMTLAGRSFETGRARAVYEHHRLSIEEMFVEHLGTRLSASGHYDPVSGLSVEIVADPVDLSEVGAELRSRYGVAVAGRMHVRAAVGGQLGAPQATVEAHSSSLTVNEVAFDQFSLSGRVAGGVASVDSLLIKSGDSEITLAGRCDYRARTLAVLLDVEDLDLGTVLTIGDRAVWRLYRAGVRSQHFAAYAKIPRPLGGRLTSQVRVTGPLMAPTAEITVALDRLAFDGRSIEHIGGDVAVWLASEGRGSLSFQRADIDLLASHEMASASIRGSIAGDSGTDLVLDIGNLDLRLLVPWLPHPVDLGGLATINFDIAGSIREPVLRGDVFVDNLRIGAFEVEAARASPIRAQQGTLVLEEVRLRNGPMEAVGNALLPLPGRSPMQALASPPKAELHLENATYSLVPGMLPATFDADVYLLGNDLLLYQSAEGQGGATLPGIRGQLGSGAFTIGGSVLLRKLAPAEWNENQFDVVCELHRAELSIPGLVTGRLDGGLELTTAREFPADAGDQMRQAAWQGMRAAFAALGASVSLVAEEIGPQLPGARPQAVLRTAADRPIVVSHAALGVPQLGKAPSVGTFPFAPMVDVWLRVGEDVRFQFGAEQRPTKILFEPGGTRGKEGGPGYLRLGGRLSAEGLRVDGEVASREGQLVFPNGVLTLRSGTAWIARESGHWRITVSAQADGRVGDYKVSLRPNGQIYPFDSTLLALNASSIPYLEEAFIKALLVGPVLAPSRGGRQDIAALLTVPGRGDTGAGGGEITGIVIPPFGGALGMHEVALDVALEGTTRLRLGEEIFRHVFVTYVSPISGAEGTRSLGATYEIKPPVWSVGWSVNERDQTRWEVQAFVPF